MVLAGSATIVAAAVAARIACLARLRDRPLRGPRLGEAAGGGRRPAISPLHGAPGFRPFIGSGLNVGSWSFAQRLVQHKVLGTEPDQEYDLPPFTTADLIGRLQQTMAGIRDDDDPGTGTARPDGDRPGLRRGNPRGAVPPGPAKRPGQLHGAACHQRGGGQPR